MIYINGKPLLVAALLLGAMAAGTAQAGECPADQTKADVREAVSFEPAGVTDDVLAAIPLAEEGPMLADRQMRVRRLVIQPDGIVPWHSHADRPALIYVVEGEILEYASNCNVPIVHQAGEVARETHVVSHWWKNLSTAPVTLLSFDILHDESDQSM